jgi:hypothetical protein
MRALVPQGLAPNLLQGHALATRKPLNLLAFLTVLAPLWLLGCGGGSADGEPEDGNTGGDAGSESGDVGADATGEEGGGSTFIDAPCAVPAGAVAANADSVKSGGFDVHYTRFVPESCTVESPCPTLFLVGDGLMGGDEYFGQQNPKELAAATGAIVITFNPPGRGIAAQRSGGEEDYNGVAAQDAFKSVITQSEKRQDTTEKLGIISFGFGLSIATGALSRHGATNLREIDFLIDVEGALNRCFITALPENPEAGIEDDGPGANGTKCDFQEVDRESAFPTGGPGPKTVLCSEASPIIAATGNDCTKDSWWRDREPNKFIPNLRVAYQRIQFLYDHAQPSRWGSLLAIHYAIQGDDIPWNRLNNVAKGTPLLAVKDGPCVEQGCYLGNASKGNGFGARTCTNFDCVEEPNPFFAEDSEYRPKTLNTFWTCDLPAYVKRTIEESTE